MVLSLYQQNFGPELNFSITGVITRVRWLLGASSSGAGAGVALAARQLFKYVSKVINQDADLIIQSSATDPQCGLARLVPARLNAVILYKFSCPRLRPRCSSCLLSEGDNSQHSTKSSITQFGQEDVSLACQTARVGVSTCFCFVLLNKDTNEHNAVKDVKHLSTSLMTKRLN